MRIRMLIEQESPKYGKLLKWEKGKNEIEYDLDPETERAFIKRGIAVNVSSPEYKSKSTPKSKKKEVS